MPDAESPFLPPGPPSELTRVRRAPERGRYDSETIHAFLDAGNVGHVGFVVGDRAMVIPTIYAREADSVYVHGSVASRMMRGLDGMAATLAVTHVDALVLARSAFHHSMNYRSVVAFGTAHTVTCDDERIHALRIITDRLVPGRWDEVRAPSRVEMRQTSVVRLDISEASAKVRAHGVGDDADDLDLPIWAGLVPLQTVAGDPIPDPSLASGVKVPDSVRRLTRA